MLSSPEPPAALWPGFAPSTTRAEEARRCNCGDWRPDEAKGQSIGREIDGYGQSTAQAGGGPGGARGGLRAGGAGGLSLALRPPACDGGFRQGDGTLRSDADAVRRACQA